jgi:hypothetical protein
MYRCEFIVKRCISAMSLLVSDIVTGGRLRVIGQGGEKALF